MGVPHDLGWAGPGACGCWGAFHEPRLGLRVGGGCLEGTTPSHLGLVTGSLVPPMFAEHQACQVIVLGLSSPCGGSSCREAGHPGCGRSGGGGMGWAGLWRHQGAWGGRFKHMEALTEACRGDLAGRLRRERWGRTAGCRPMVSTPPSGAPGTWPCGCHPPLPSAQVAWVYARPWEFPCQQRPHPTAGASDPFPAPCCLCTA